MIKIGDIIISNLFIGSTQVSKVYLGDVKVWPIPTPIPTETNYVTFTAQQDNSSIGLNQLSTNQTLEYSTDTVTWNTFNTKNNIPLNTGNKVYVRGKLNSSNTSSNYTQFKMSGKIAASGNTNSIWDYENLNAPLEKGCGYRLFYECSALTTAPALPATTLANYCYYYMFYGCTSLTTAPELPATTLTDSCYYYMFYGCTSLTTAPELPATTLAPSCYHYMFDGCSALTTAPELPATTLTDSCYYSMFDGCSALTTAPELPATTLAPSCYRYMFSGCSALTTAPELPATTLAAYCYYYMFNSCTSLNYIKCLAVNDINTNGSTYYWVAGVASTGTFVKDPNATSWTTGVNGIPTGWVVKDVDTPYVTFTAQQNNSSIGLNRLSTNQTLEYSTDTVTWNTFNTSTNISLNTGDKVYVRGKLSADNTTSNYTQFKMSGKIAASGNTNSLWDYENPDAQLKQYCGYRLFYDCTSLTTAPELHATTLALCCYRYMFYNCTGLTKAPELPATTLAKGCYWYMFKNCTSLTAAPELHATTLAGYCYEYMFQDCTSLNYIKCFAVNGINTNYSTYNWVSGVPSNGTFVKDSKANWPTGVNGIPEGWTTQDA